MITEDTDDEPSLSLMEMTIPMLVILAVIGLITAYHMVVQCYRQRWPQPQEHYRDEDELHTTTINVEDVMRLSVSYDYFAHIQGGVKIIM